MLLEAVSVNKCKINVLNELNRFIYGNSHDLFSDLTFFILVSWQITPYND
jgi:hypothetical protein